LPYVETNQQLFHRKTEELAYIVRMPAEFIPFFYFNLFIAISQLMVAAFLFFKRNNTMANRLLGMVMFYPASAIAINIIFLLLQLHNFVFLSTVNIGISMTFGPVLLAYIRMLQGKKARVNARYFLHFIPSALIMLSSVQYFFLTDAERQHTLSKILAGEDLYTNCINLLLLFHIMVYLFAAYRNIQTYASSVQEFCSSIEDVHIKWMRSIVNYITCMNLILLLAYALPILVTGKAHIYSDLIATPGVSALLYGFMIYKGFSYHAIYDQPSYMQLLEQTQALNSFIDQKQTEPAARKFDPEDDKVEEVRQKIEDLFSSSKIHTEPGLKLHMVAERLNMSPTLLSRYINTAFGSSFFDLVNRYRVEEAQKLLTDNTTEDLKLEYIGKMAGFNSKTSFFGVFKKYTHKTPAEYRKELSGIPQPKQVS